MGFALMRNICGLFKSYARIFPFPIGKSLDTTLLAILCQHLRYTPSRKRLGGRAIAVMISCMTKLLWNRQAQEI